MRVAVMLLSFNRIEYFKTVLREYLTNTTYPHILRIVDNGSTDGSAEYIQYLRDSGIIEIQYPHIKTEFRLNTENLMYQKPVNDFWREQPPEVEYFGRVLDDIVVEKGWLEEFVRILDTYPKIGVITTGDGPHTFKLIVEQEPQRLYKPNETEWFVDVAVNGHCQLLRRSMIKEISDNMLISNDGYIEDRGVMAPCFHYTYVMQAGYHVCSHSSMATRMCDVDPFLTLQSTNKYKHYRNVIDAHKLGKIGKPPEDMYKGIPIVGEYVDTIIPK